MKLAKKITLLLCEDIREEKGNKLSVMGVYGYQLVLDRIPAMLPKLCLCVMLTEIVTVFSRFDVTVTLPNSEPILLTISGMSDVALGENRNLGIIVSPARINAAGKARFELCFDEEKKPSIIHRFEIVEKKG